ncbi:MAG: bifunctional diaminohydroxyphosphoribosylaminopyrimidine deaminase/5-amino-6-(5-phosphoribosylamino)uracil reductase RibD [Candidatus Cloacimonetes bacterium]|nr:bifunctional diaminohydroxyphosphoribosylaminopyrimidine deaminase/5-amino-6-(5-phosphoribosylamino)uracil reductase RibD [Candidatus Cloacimonadota bacterium]
MSSTDKAYMQLAMREAEKARGHTSPNPFVGAIIVKDGKILAKGRTQSYGSDHAEVDALIKAGAEAKGASMYVTLEPCCHYGKTPPCTKAIIKAGIRKVIIGIEDPNPLVAGKGIEELRTAGIEVVEGILSEAIRTQNEAFLCHIQKQRPFVIWKAALSLDGKFAAMMAALSGSRTKQPEAWCIAIVLNQTRCYPGFASVQRMMPCSTLVVQRSETAFTSSLGPLARTEPQIPLRALREGLSRSGFLSQRGSTKGRSTRQPGTRTGQSSG